MAERCLECDRVRRLLWALPPFMREARVQDLRTVPVRRKRTARRGSVKPQDGVGRNRRHGATPAAPETEPQTGSHRTTAHILEPTASVAPSVDRIAMWRGSVSAQLRSQSHQHVPARGRAIAGQTSSRSLVVTQVVQQGLASRVCTYPSASRPSSFYARVIRLGLRRPCRVPLGARSDLGTAARQRAGPRPAGRCAGTRPPIRCAYRAGIRRDVRRHRPKWALRTAQDGHGPARPLSCSAAHARRSEHLTAPALTAPRGTGAVGRSVSRTLRLLGRRRPASQLR